MIGVERSVTFRPGLNIISGPIGSGKTSFVRLCRSLLGHDFGTLPPEIKRNVTAISGDLLLGDEAFSVVRPLTTSDDAMVDIVGDGVALRLPASRGRTNSTVTYASWLLDRLNLPRLEVPQAPTNLMSAQTPVTINDYFIYCNLAQDEIDVSVFGHHHHQKNVKRKYVFQIVYGLYSVEMARLHERYREIETQIRSLQAEGGFFERFSKDTPWENRAELEAQLAAEETTLARLESAATDVASEARESPEVVTLQESLRRLESAESDLAQRHLAESRAVEQLRRLLA